MFPEFGKFFKSGIHIAASYALLKKYSSLKEIAALRTSTLFNLLSKASHGRFGKDTAEALKSLALSSVGVKNPYISIQIAQTIAQIELLERQIKDLNSAIEDAMESINSVLMTVPGIGAVNAARQLTLNDPTFKAYYDLKRSQGLTITVLSVMLLTSSPGSFLSS